MDAFIKENADLVTQHKNRLIICVIVSDNGDTARSICETFTQSHIIVFVLQDSMIATYEEKLHTFKDRVTFVKQSVCNYTGNIEYYVRSQEAGACQGSDNYANTMTSSLLLPIQDSSTSPHAKIQTSCITLTSFMHRTHHYIDLLVLDYCGAELYALVGLGRYFNYVSMVCCRVFHTPMFVGQPMYSHVDDLMKKQKFLPMTTPSHRDCECMLYGNSGFLPYRIDSCSSILYKDTANNDAFDIVIPVGPNEEELIRSQIEYTRKHVVGYRNIYLICVNPDASIDGCITIDEKTFIVNINHVAQIHGGKRRKRNGWYLQQLLKWYAFQCIPGILDKYLIIDADTYFLRPTTFIKDGKCLYNWSGENWQPYFRHMEKLDIGLRRLFKDKSGICHHMLVEARFLQEIIDVVEKVHNDKFYNVMLRLVENTSLHNAAYENSSGFSEYEIYFNYVMKYHAEDVELRHLKFLNSPTLDLNADVDYISHHWWMRS